MNLIRKITNADGTNPYVLPRSVLFSTMSRPDGLNLSTAVGRHGTDYQSRRRPPMSTSLTGTLLGETHTELRTDLDAISDALGLRNKRLYRYDDRYWIVRCNGISLAFPHVGARDMIVEITINLTMMNPMLLDADGVEHEWW